MIPMLAIGDLRVTVEIKTRPNGPRRLLIDVPAMRSLALPALVLNEQALEGLMTAIGRSGEWVSDPEGGPVGVLVFQITPAAGRIVTRDPMGVFAADVPAPPRAGRAELDMIVARGCTEPGCPCALSHVPLTLISNCHPQDGVVATYWQGVLRLACRRCLYPLFDIAVKS